MEPLDRGVVRCFEGDMDSWSGRTARNIEPESGLALGPEPGARLVLVAEFVAERRQRRFIEADRKSVV